MRYSIGQDARARTEETSCHSETFREHIDKDGSLDNRLGRHPLLNE